MSGHATVLVVGTGSGSVQVRRTLDAHFADVIVLRARQP
jgi:hypothetical protein